MNLEMRSPSPGMKVCKVCRQEKAVNQFSKSENHADRLRPMCRPCNAEYHRTYYADPVNKERMKRVGRMSYLFRTYGITEAQYQEMLEAQGGVCLLCCRPPTPDKALAVDHCHKTGMVRGLLCDACNLALGVVDRCPEWPERVTAYLNLDKP